MKIFALLCFTLSCSVALSSDYSCFGTNPYWSLELKESQANYLADYEVFGLESGKIEMISTDGQLLVGNDSSLQFVTKKCNDGMTEATYGHQVIFKLGTETLIGCCN